MRRARPARVAVISPEAIAKGEPATLAKDCRPADHERKRRAADLSRCASPYYALCFVCRSFEASSGETGKSATEIRRELC